MILNKKNDIMIYRAYISDMLMNITDIMLKYGGVDNPETPRYIDIINGNKKEPEPEITAEDVILRFKQQCEMYQKGGE